MRLLVRGFGRFVGTLDSTPDRGVVFSYDGAYLADTQACPLSLSLLLPCHFFTGLLPDGDARQRARGRPRLLL